MQQASLGRHRRGRHHWTDMGEVSWGHLETSGGIWEASGSMCRHLGGICDIWEASGRQLEASAGIWRHLEACGRHLASI